MRRTGRTTVRESWKHNLAANVMSGGVITILNVTSAISIAALVFAGMPSHLFFVGVAILLLSTTVCALGGAIGSEFGQVVLSPNTSLAPIYAAIVASVGSALPVGAPAIVPTLLVAIMIGTLLTGLFLFVVGQFHLGTLIRYIPYPVMAGFFAGLGLIFVLGGLAVASGEAVSLKNLAYHLSPAGLELTVPALIVGFLLYAITLKVDHWSALPLLLVTAVIIFYVALYSTGTTVQDAIAARWLPKPTEAAISLPFVKLSDLSLVDWTIVLRQSGAFATLAFLATIILLIGISGIEMVADMDLDPDRELKVAGITNIVNGVIGGYVGTQLPSKTALVVKLGATSRVCGFLYAGLVAFVTTIGTGVVDVIPSFVLGGLLSYLGLDLLMSWTWSKRRDLHLHDFAVVLGIVAAIAFVGLLPGIAIGFGIAVILFVISYSRLSVVKAEHGGDVHDSIVVRHPEKRVFLNKESCRIWIMKLQGFLFFGTADRLLRTIRHRVENAETPGISHIVLDFANVSQIDTSAMQMLARLGKYARRENLTVLLSGLDDRTQRRILDAGFSGGRGGRVGHGDGCFHPTLNAGVAWCEADLLESFKGSGVYANTSLESLLTRFTGTPEAAAAVVPFFKREEAPKGTYLFKEGDQTTSLYILATGTASVVIGAGTERERIIRTFEEGTIVGEMALFTGDPRSASVRVEGNATLYRLTQSDFLNAQLTQPEAIGRLQSYIIRLLAERLNRANREIQSLN